MSASQDSVFKRYSYLFEGLVWLLFVLLAGIYTFDFDDPLPVYEWGPAHWPRVVLVGMFMASSWLIFIGIRRERHKKSQTKDTDAVDMPMSIRVRMLLVFSVPVLYAFLIHKMGFLLITPFFLFGYMWLMGVKRLRTLIIMTVSIYAGIVIIFVKLIFTYLPPGAGVFNTINGTILGLLQ